MADVLGEEQLRRVSALEQLDDDLDQPRLERLLDPEPMAEEVELEVRAGIEDGEVEVEVGMRVGVTDDDARRVDALLGEDPQLREADRRLDAVRRDRHAGPDRCARRGAMHPLLQRADPRLVGADLADDPGTDAGSAHAIGELADDHPREVVDGAAVDQRPRPGSARRGTSRSPSRCSGR